MPHTRCRGRISSGPEPGSSSRRIVYAYDVHLDEARISVSSAKVELKPAGPGTRRNLEDLDEPL